MDGLSYSLLLVHPCRCGGSGFPRPRRFRDPGAVTRRLRTRSRRPGRRTRLWFADLGSTINRGMGEGSSLWAVLVIRPSSRALTPTLGVVEQKDVFLRRCDVPSSRARSEGGQMCSAANGAASAHRAGRSHKVKRQDEAFSGRARKRQRSVSCRRSVRAPSYLGLIRNPRELSGLFGT